MHAIAGGLRGGPTGIGGERRKQIEIGHAERCRELAGQTMVEVRQKLGLA